MRLVGTQALGATSASGVVVVRPVGDLAATVRLYVRTLGCALLRALVRVPAVTLRSCRPVAAGLAVALRARSVLPLVAAARAATQPLAVAPRLVARALLAQNPLAQNPLAPSPIAQNPLAQNPFAQSPVAEDPVAQSPAVPPVVAAQFAPLCRHEVALPADPTAPRRARALLRAATQDWDLDEDLSHDAAMVVTELVANAVDHAGTTSTLRVDLDERGLYVAVRDGRPDSALRPQPVDPTAPRGRGLQMIDALTASWGVIRHADGKTVWAMLRLHRP